MATQPIMLSSYSVLASEAARMATDRKRERQTPPAGHQQQQTTSASSQSPEPHNSNGAPADSRHKNTRKQPSGQQHHQQQPVNVTALAQRIQAHINAQVQALDFAQMHTTKPGSMLVQAIPFTAMLFRLPIPTHLPHRETEAAIARLLRRVAAGLLVHDPHLEDDQDTYHRGDEKLHDVGDDEDDEDSSSSSTTTTTTAASSAAAAAEARTVSMTAAAPESSLGSRSSASSATRWWSESEAAPADSQSEATSSHHRHQRRRSSNASDHDQREVNSRLFLDHSSLPNNQQIDHHQGQGSFLTKEQLQQQQQQQPIKLSSKPSIPNKPPTLLTTAPSLSSGAISPLTPPHANSRRKLVHHHYASPRGPSRPSSTTTRDLHIPGPLPASPTRPTLLYTYPLPTAYAREYATSSSTATSSATGPPSSYMAHLNGADTRSHRQNDTMKVPFGYKHAPSPLSSISSAAPRSSTTSAITSSFIPRLRDIPDQKKQQQQQQQQQWEPLHYTGGVPVDEFGDLGMSGDNDGLDSEMDLLAQFRDTMSQQVLARARGI